MHTDKRLNMPLHYNKTDNIVIIYPSGRLDFEQSNNIDRDLQNLSSIESDSNFLLNMSAVDYVNSYGLKVILKTYNNFKQDGRLFALCNINNTTRKLFDLIGQDDMFEVFNSEKEGLDFLK